MSFRCEACNKAQKSGATPKVFVAERRHRRYGSSETVGFEIAKELKLCESCWEKTQEDA